MLPTSFLNCTSPLYLENAVQKLEPIGAVVHMSSFQLPNFTESFIQSSLPCSLGLPALGVKLKPS